MANNKAKTQKLLDAGYEAAKAGKPCIAPTTRELDRMKWEQGWRACVNEIRQNAREKYGPDWWRYAR
jgi:hypothetical protein